MTDFAGGEDDGEAEDVVGSDAVLQAVGAARVLGDIAADGGDLLAGRVGAELETERRKDILQIEVDDAGLHGGTLIGDINIEDLVHAGELDDEAAAHGDRAAGEIGAGAAGDEGNPVLAAPVDEARDFLCGGGKGHGVGLAGDGGGVVAV